MMGELVGSARYEIEGRVGAGGMGVVYRALDRERGVRVALKTLRALDAQSLYLFKKEFRALADLHHPHLCSLGELVNEEGQWYFTMELVLGKDFLAHVVPTEEMPPLPPPPMDHTATMSPSARAAAMDGTAPVAAPPQGPRPAFDEGRLRAALGQLAEGLAFLHAAGKVHRDVKPSNVLVTPEGRVVVLDFGLIADAVANDLTEQPGAYGTPAYMAPEQAAAQPIGPPADWYAVGVILYRALTGGLPIDGAPFAVMQQKQVLKPAPPRSLVPEVPEDLDALCRDLLEIDPAARPLGDEVLARLRAGTATARATARTGESSGVLRVPFVGREGEIGILEEALARSRGRAVAVCVGGESGLGKTALVRRFLEGLAGRDPTASVLAGRCYERESVPYKAFDGIVDALSHGLRRLGPVAAAGLLPRERDAAMLVRLFPVLGRVEPLGGIAALGPADEADAGDLRARAFRGLRELLTRLADRGPLVLFVDDLQWADRDSLLLLDEVLDPPDAPALLFVATLRGIEPPVLPCEARAFRLAPLSAAESRALADLLLPAVPVPGPEGAAGAGAGAGRSRAEALAEEAHGHPLFIQELARSAEAAALAGQAGAAVPRLDDVLRARVAGLEPEARRLVEVVAAAGAPIPQRTAVEAAGLAPDEGVRRIAELRAARLFRTLGAPGSDAVEMYHDRVREAVVDGLDEAARRALYLGLADALERGGAAESAPTALVLNLEAAGEAERAARYAERAAARAARALAFDRAAELYRKALELGRPAPERARELHAALGDALANAGRGPEAARAFLAAADGAAPEERLRCRTQAARHLLGSGHIEDGVEVMRGVLAEAGGRWPRTPLRTLLSLLWNRAVLRIRGLGFRVREERELPPRDVLEADAFHAAASCMAGIDPFRAAAFEARAVRLALGLGDRLRVIRALVAHVNYAATEGTKVEGRTHRGIEHVRALIESEARPEARVHLAISLGLTNFFAGRFREAEPWLIDIDARIRAHAPSMGPERATAYMVRLWAIWCLGRIGELRRLVHESLRDAAHRGDRYLEATVTRFFIAVWLAEDDPAGARAQLARLSWAPPAGGYHIQHFYELGAGAEIDIYEGKVRGDGIPAGFAEVERSHLMRIQILRAYANWLRGRLALAAPLPAPDEAERRAAHLEGEGPPYARAFGRLLRAGVAVSRAAPSEAVRFLRDAVTVAEEDGFGLIAALARRRLGALLGGDEGAALVAAADAFMTGEGIRRPERIAAVYAPGFERAPRSEVSTPR